MATPMNNTGSAVGSVDPRDLQDNAQVLDKLLNANTPEVTSRQGKELKSWAGIESDLDAIITSLDTASFTFPDIASGLAATTNGQYFRVPQGATSNNAFIYYRKVSGSATIVAITKGAEIYGAPLLSTDNINDLPGGMYYITSFELGLLISSGNAVSLGYPSGMKAVGGATITVSRKGTTSERYQTLSFTSQGIIHLRQWTSSGMSQWIDVSSVTVKMAFGNRLNELSSLNTLSPKKYYITSTDLSKLITNGNYEALGYPAGIVADGGASIDVVGDDTLSAVYQVMTFPKQGVIYSRQTAATGFYQWVNINNLITEASSTEIKKYVDDNFYKKDLTPVDMFPFGDLTTNPDFVSRASDWKIETDSSGNRTITVMAVTAGVGAYAGWTFGRGDIPDTFTIKGSNYSILTGSSFLIRVRILDSSTVLKTYDIIPVRQSDGTYSFEKKITDAPTQFNSLRISIVIDSSVAPCTVSSKSHDFIQVVVTPESSIEEIVKKEVESSISENLPELVKEEIEKQLPNVGGDGIGDAIKKGRVILLDSGAVLDRRANYNFISWWGASSIARMSDQLVAMSNQQGIMNSFNGGGSGELFQHHAARMGAIPAIVSVPGGLIPSSGPVPVAIHNFQARNISSLKSYTGTLHGITGSLYPNSSSSTGFYFSRSSSGTALAVSSNERVKFIPNYNLNYISGYCILNVGKNNFTLETDTPDEVMDATNKMYDFVRPFFKRVVLLNHYPNRNANASTISAIKSYNSDLENAYEGLVVDNFAYLMGPQIWIDAGITPTSADLASQAKGEIAPSLSSDALHMNTNISQLVVDKLIKPLMQELWFS